MIRRVISYSLLFLVAACGAANTETCTTSTGTPTAHTIGENNSKCPVGSVLVGYDPNAIGGPLICATLATSCPVSTK
jgi:hypothetical protein